MSHTARQLMAATHKAQIPTTMRIERLDAMEKVVRVVASFNRMPKADALKAAVEKAFAGKLEVIPGSFRNRTPRGQNGRVQVAGFLREKVQVLPLTETANFKEVASNVFMDPADNSIWVPQNGQIMRQATESLAELASLASVEKSLHRAPALASVQVRPFAGPTNTMIIAYVDPTDPTEVKTAVRIDEDHVWSEDDGITELSEDLVVDTESLAGSDYEPTLAETAALDDPQAMIDYYSKVYGFDPAYLEGVKKVIETRALV